MAYIRENVFANFHESLNSWKFVKMFPSNIGLAERCSSMACSAKVISPHFRNLTSINNNRKKFRWLDFSVELDTPDMKNQNHLISTLTISVNRLNFFEVYEKRQYYNDVYGLLVVETLWLKKRLVPRIPISLLSWTIWKLVNKILEMRTMPWN